MVQIADRLLELDEHLRAIAQDPIGVSLRPYIGEIDQLFGRDLHGHITGGASKEAAIISCNLYDQENGFKEISQFMLNDNYDFLVTNREPREGFELVDRVNDFGFIRAIGNPTVIKTCNEKRQNTSITTVDETGQPLDNETGFATISYYYNDDGFINHKSWVTVSGKQYMQPAGYYETVEEYDSKSNLLTRSYLNAKGIEDNRSEGFSRTEWKKGGVEKVVLLDDEGSPIDITGINLVIDADENWSEWI